MTEPPTPSESESAELHWRALVGRLFSGSAKYGLATLAQRGIAFLLIPIYTAFLSPTEYGIVSLAETIAAVLLTLFGLSLPAALRNDFHDLAEGERDEFVATLVIGTAVLLVGLGGLSMLVGPAVVGTLWPEFTVPFYPFVDLAIAAAAARGLLELHLAHLQMKEQSSRYVAISFGQFLLVTAVVLVFVVGLRQGSFGMLAGKALGLGAVTLAVGTMFRRYYRPSLFVWRRFVKALKFSWPLVPHQLIALVLTAADRFFIEHYRTTEDVGLYSLAYALAGVMTVVSSSILLAWTPLFYRLANTDDGGQRLARVGEGLVGVLVVAGCLGTVVSADVVAWIVDARYVSAAPVVPIVIAGLLLHGCFAVFHLAVLRSGRTSMLAMVTIIAAVLNVVLNALWVPDYGVEGAAWATVLSYLVEAAVVFVLAQRLMLIRYTYRLPLVLALFAGTVAAVVFRDALDLSIWGLLAIGTAASIATIAVVGHDGWRAYRQGVASK